MSKIHIFEYSEYIGLYPSDTCREAERLRKIDSFVKIMGTKLQLIRRRECIANGIPVNIFQSDQSVAKYGLRGVIQLFLA